MRCTVNLPNSILCTQGAPLRMIEAAQFRASTLAKQGYYGWILRLQEVRQEDCPEDHWRIDHRREDAIAWLAQF